MQIGIKHISITDKIINEGPTTSDRTPGVKRERIKMIPAKVSTAVLLTTLTLGFIFPYITHT
ncbi:hypothetical protein OAG1_15590 [Agarivorans sp. OAG1]|nr:hypothetical protein OAG1_15590 [Agarivorans sp. OAG1]